YESRLRGIAHVENFDARREAVAGATRIGLEEQPVGGIQFVHAGEAVLRGSDVTQLFGIFRVAHVGDVNALAVIVRAIGDDVNHDHASEGRAPRRVEHTSEHWRTRV